MGQAGQSHRAIRRAPDVNATAARNVRDGGYFDDTGVIYDGLGAWDRGLGVKKLAWYTYKKITEVLEGADWNSVEVVLDDGDVFACRFIKNGRAIYAVWWDYFNRQTFAPQEPVPISLAGVEGASVTVTEVVPSAESGGDVTDYATAFRRSTLPVNAGVAELTVGEGPVLVEVSSTARRRAVRNQ